MTKEILHMTSNSADLTCDIVAAYVSNNSVPASELPNFIRSVHDAVQGLTCGSVLTAIASEPKAEKPNAAQIRKSVRDDGIVSFIDGKAYKTLKRHLTANGHDPHSYRDRYGLPADYPMVAPSYAEHRSALTKAIGLGQPGAMAQRQPKQPRGRRKAA